MANFSTLTVHPGDVIVADFPGITGVKRRLALVISSDTYHTVRPDVILGLLTGQVAAATSPTDYFSARLAASRPAHADRFSHLGSLGFRGVRCWTPQLVEGAAQQTPTSWGVRYVVHANSQDPAPF